MAQGDISSALNELVKKLQVNTAASLTTRSEIERYVGEVVDSYSDAIEKNNEAYNWDVKRESLFGYLKKISKHREQLIEEKIARKNELEFLDQQINHYIEKENEAIKAGKSRLSKELFQKRVELEIQKNVKEAIDDVANTAKTASKSGNPYLAAFLVVGGILIDVGKAILRVGLSILKIGFSFIKDLFGADFGVSAVFELFLKMQSISGDISANIGLVSQEYIRFYENMPKIYNEVLDVGGSLEDVQTVVEKLSDVTGRSNILEGPMFKRVIELGLGTGLGVENATELIGNFQNLGYSMDKTLEFTDFVRDKSMSMSMNQTKVLSKVNELVVSLTGFGVNRGLKAMTNLVIDAQRLRLDVNNSVDKFKDAFTDPEMAVEVAANVKLLGGKFAFYFGDPFKLMAKSMYEPQELTAELLEALKDKAFKGKNGNFQISPADREIIREFAKSIGQDNVDELFNVAIEQSKFADKIEALGKRFGSISSITEEQRILLTNLMTMNEDGSYSIKLSSGSKRLLSEIPSINTIYNELRQERKNNESALLRKNLAERIGIAIERFNVGFSQIFIVMDRYFRNSNVINHLDETLKGMSIMEGDFFNDLLSPSGAMGNLMKNIFKAANSFIDTILGIWQNPELSIFQAVSMSLDYMITRITTQFMDPLKFYLGRLVELIGVGIDKGTGGLFGKGVARTGLQMQKKAIRKSGEGSMFYEAHKSGLNERIKEFNQRHAESMSGVKINTDVNNKINNKSNKVDGKLPAIKNNIVKPVGLDVIALKNRKETKTNDLLVRANGATLMGSKGDALLFFNEMVLGDAIANAKPEEINLVLNGKLSHIKKNKELSLTNKKLDKTIKLSSAMLIKQATTNLENSVI